MFSRLRNVVLWQYPDDTPVEKLLRHRRWAVRVLSAWATAAVLMASSMADGLLTNGEVLRTAAFVVCIGATAVSFLLTLPALGAYCWATDIDKALDAHGQQIPPTKPLDVYVGKVAMKMMFYYILVILIVNVLSRF